MFLAHKCQSGLSCKVPGFSSAVSVWVEVGSSSWSPRSDAGELVPEAGWQDALHLLHDEVQRSEQRAEELQDKDERLHEWGFISCCILATVTKELRWGWGVVWGRVSERFPRQIKAATGFVERERSVCVPSSPPAWVHPGLTQRIITHLCSCCNVHFKVKGVCLK